MTRRLLAILVLVLGACTSLPPAPSEDTAAPAVSVPQGAVTGVVERVVDGDTLIAEVAGERERVRLLRIDAPEAARDGDPAECLADSATAALEQLLPPGAEVDLAVDVERRDRFGRLLAHAWVDDAWVNGALLEAGLAQVLTIPPNVGYDNEVRAAATRAREEGVGLWDPAAC